VLAHRHRVAQYVLDAVQLSDLVVPPETVTYLKGAVFTGVAQAMVLDDTLARVARALQAAGIPLIVLKGPALARTIYADPRLRPYDDLDVVVRPEDESSAVMVLTSLGFAEESYEAEVARRTHRDHVHEVAAFHRRFVLADSTATLELHLDPMQLGLRPAGEEARWRRATSMPGVPGAQILGPEDQLVHLSVHAQKHGYSRLIWLKDLDLLLRTYGDGLEWSLVKQVAARAGAEASVWYSLRLATRLLGTPVPRHAQAMLRPWAPVRALYELVWSPATIAALDGRMRRRAVQFVAAESWRGMLPSLLFMGRRRQRLRALLQSRRLG
jgi:hypothetical protein